MATCDTGLPRLRSGDDSRRSARRIGPQASSDPAAFVEHMLDRAEVLAKRQQRDPEQEERRDEQAVDPSHLGREAADEAAR